MEKRKKLKSVIKRCSAIMAAALVLLMSVFTAITPSANALILHPTDETENSFDWMKWMLPLDTFGCTTFDMVIENPLFLYTLDGHSHSLNYYNDTSCSSYLGTGLVWNFGATQHYASRDEEGNLSSALVDYKIIIPTQTSSCGYTFNNSAPFIATPAIIEKFLHSLSVKINPGYGLSAGIVISYLSADITDNGYRLDPITYYKEFNNYISKEDDLVLKSSSTYWDSIFDDFSQYELVFLDSPDASLLYIEHLSIHFELKNPADGFGDTYDTGFVSASEFEFTCLVSPDSTGFTFIDFYEAYPSSAIIQYPDNFGSFGVSFISNTVGTFLRTEIIPGLSFGVILSALLGIGIVMLLFKWFGG